MDERFTAIELLKKSKSVLEHLTDDLSRQIYEVRLKYLFDRDAVSLKDKLFSFCQNIDENSKLNVIAERYGEFDNIIIFGSGAIGHRVLNQLRKSKYNNKNIMFCDNDSSKWNNKGGGY